MYLLSATVDNHQAGFKALVLSSLKCGLLAFVASASIVFATVQILKFTPYPWHQGLPTYALSLSDIVGLVVFAPVLETVLLIGTLKLLARMIKQQGIICLIAAFGWATLHGLIAPIRFLGVIFSFFWFSQQYFNWRQSGAATTFLAVLLPHMLLNGLALIILAVYD